MSKYETLKFLMETKFSSDRMHYYVKDYQGNVRQVTDADGAVVQDNLCYPIKLI